MSEQKMLSEMFEMITFLKDNAVTKTELDVKFSSFEKKLNDKIDSVEIRLNDKIDSVEIRLNDKIDSVEIRLNDKIDSVKDELDAKIVTVKNDLMDHIDGFARNQNTFELELSALQAKTDRNEKHIRHMSKHVHMPLK